MLYRFIIAGCVSALISLNAYAGSWGYIQPGDTLMFNGSNNSWSYEPPGSVLQFNGFN